MKIYLINNMKVLVFIFVNADLSVAFLLKEK